MGYPYCKLYAIANAGAGGQKGQGGKLKAEGVRKGVPDLKLPVARGGYFGLYIEMKVGDNKPTREQWEWIEDLRTEGYKVVVCWGCEEALVAITEYMALPPTPRR
jgi:hypothetical protein